MKMQSIFWFNLAACTSGIVYAQVLTWDGGSATWTEPDSLHWSGETYNIGSNVQFTGSGGTVTITNTGVQPGSILVDSTENYTFTGGSIGGVGMLTKTNSGILTLSSSNSFGGGIVIQGGRIDAKDDVYLGSRSGMITLDGGEFRAPSVNLTSARDFAVATGGGRLYVNKNNMLQTTGKMTGAGTLELWNPGGSGQPPDYRFLTTSNDFMGALVFRAGTEFWCDSFADGPSNLVFQGTGDASTIFRYNSGAIVPMVFNTRAIEIQGSSALTVYIDNYASTSNAITFNSDLVASTTASATLCMRGSNNGTNRFAGDIGLSSGGGAIGLQFQSSGTWILSGSNSYTGGTVLNSGALVADAAHALGAGDVSVSSGTQLVIDTNVTMAGALFLPSASTANLALNGDLTVGALSVAGVSKPVGVYTNEAWIDGSGVLRVGEFAIQPLWWDADGNTAGAGGTTPAGTWGIDTFWSTSPGGDVITAGWVDGRTAVFAAGTNAIGSYSVGVNGTLGIAGITFEEGNVMVSGGTALQLQESGGTLYAADGATGSVATVISEGATERSIIKDGPGVIVLSGANTVSGPTTVMDGTLVLNNDSAIPPETVDLAGHLQMDANIVMSNLVFSAEDVSVSGSGYLNFVTGAVINSDWRFSSTAGSGGAVHAITCGISGAPDVLLRQSQWNASDPKCKQNRFEPSVGVTQSLGIIRFDYYDESGRGGLVVLGGSSTNNTVESFSAPNHAYDDRIQKEGSGTWTITGDSDGQYYGLDVFVRGGTLIWNGSLGGAGDYSIMNGRFAGNHNFSTTYDAPGSVNVMTNGVLSPGVDDVGKMNFNWFGTQQRDTTLHMQDGSIYEYDVGVLTNDLIHLSGSSSRTQTLDLDNFILRVLDAGGKPAGEPLPVFTYDAHILVDMIDFSNTAENFDLDTGGIPSWGYGGLSLSNNVSEGVIYIVGLVKPPSGTMLILR